MVNRVCGLRIAKRNRNIHGSRVLGMGREAKQEERFKEGRARLLPICYWIFENVNQPFHSCKSKLDAACRSALVND